MNSLIKIDTITDDLVQYKGTWLMNCKVSSIDISMRSKDEKLAIMHVFKQVLTSFNTSVQLTLNKFQLDFSNYIFGVKANAMRAGHENLKIYGSEYADFLQELSEGKLDKVNYLTIRTEGRCAYEEAKAYLTGIQKQIERAFKAINMHIEVISGMELKKLYTFPDFIKEEQNYWIYGNEYKRTYVILDYPRNASPNWLMPIIGFQHAVQITQHLHPFPKDKIIHSLEMSVSKLESTVNMQSNFGVPSSEIVVRLNDAKELLSRLASGKDSIIETGFTVTISAKSLLELKNISYQMESALRQIQVKYRTSVKDNNQAIITYLPLCEDGFMDENYTFDTLSLSRLVPYTAQDYTNGGILYGVNEELAELITFDIWELPNANKVILGGTGYGKSLMSKLEIARHLSEGTQAIVIDHSKEYMRFCEKFGGQYVGEGEKPNWNNQLIVFSGEHKAGTAYNIWNYVVAHPNRPRIFTIEEVHNLLKEDKGMLLDIMREIRKMYVSPTLITQNVKEFLRTDEGQMIIDLCQMKFLLNQGDNDMEELVRILNLSNEEKLYLKTCQQGHGYLMTKLFKTKFKTVFAPKEYEILTTKPKDKYGKGDVGWKR